jgi:hypothetical protein
MSGAYGHVFAKTIADVKGEGRYRVFADIRRTRGSFPAAEQVCADGSVRPITVWCSNDYLGQGQNPVVLQAMREAIDTTTLNSNTSLRTCTVRKRPSFLPRRSLPMIQRLRHCRSCCLALSSFLMPKITLR